MVSIRAQTEFNCARGGRGGVVGRKTRQERANLQKNGFAGIFPTIYSHQASKVATSASHVALPEPLAATEGVDMIPCRFSQITL